LKEFDLKLRFYQFLSLNFFAEINNKNISSKSTKEFVKSFISKLETDLRFAQDFIEKYGMNENESPLIPPLLFLRGDVFKSVLASLNCLSRDEFERSKPLDTHFLYLSRLFLKEKVDNELHNNFQKLLIFYGNERIIEMMFKIVYGEWLVEILKDEKTNNPFYFSRINNDWHNFVAWFIMFLFKKYQKKEEKGKDWILFIDYFVSIVPFEKEMINLVNSLESIQLIVFHENLEVKILRGLLPIEGMKNEFFNFAFRCIERLVEKEKPEKNSIEDLMQTSGLKVKNNKDYKKIVQNLGNDKIEENNIINKQEQEELVDQIKGWFVKCLCENHLDIGFQTFLNAFKQIPSFVSKVFPTAFEYIVKEKKQFGEICTPF
jgi:hypothetical protein